MNMMMRYLLAALSFATIGAHAQTITNLTAGSAVSGADLFESVQSGNSRKVTATQIKTFTSDSPTLVTPVLGTPASGNFSTGTFTWPTFNQSTTGSAATLTTPRAIYGNNFDGSAALTQIIASTFGGTGNGFTKFTGPTTAERTFTLPDADATILYSGGALGTPSGGTATNLTGTASGLTAGTVTTNANLTGDVTSSGNATTLATVNSNVGSFTNASITVNAKGLITAASTGSGGSGTVTATGGALTANAVVLGAGTTDTKVVAGITTDGVGALTLADGTVTASTPVINATQTWNNAGVTFTGLKLNATSTASAAASLLMDLQVGGTSQFSVSKAGVLDLAGTVGAVSSIKATGSSGVIGMNTSTITMNAGTGATAYTLLGGADAGFKVFGSALDGSAIAELRFDSASDLGANKNHGGLKLTRVGTGTTEDVKAFEIAETWNAGGVTFTAIKSNVTDTASASGSLLMDLQVGAATKFNVDKAGSVTIGGSLIVSTSATPAAADACTAGRIVWGADYIYVCTASGAWKRAAITGSY